MVYLAPSLPVPYLHLILEVYYEFIPTWHHPIKPASIGGTCPRGGVSNVTLDSVDGSGRCGTK